MRGVLVSVDEPPRVIDVDDVQALVDDLVDECNTVFPDNVSMYVSDTFMYNGMRPNRALFATEQTGRMGYGSINSAPKGRVAEEGDLILVVRGPILVIGYDPHTGEDIDLGDAETEEAMRYFSTVSMPGSGAAASLYMGLAPNDRAPTAKDLRDMGVSLPRHYLIPKEGAGPEAKDMLDGTSLYFSYELEHLRDHDGPYAEMLADVIDENWVEGYKGRPERADAGDIGLSPSGPDRRQEKPDNNRKMKH